MTNDEKQRIEDFINTHRVYPKEYQGKRDRMILQLLGTSFYLDPKTNMITRLEGRINDNGDFEIVGRFTFPLGKPEEKVPVAKTYKTKAVIARYNQIVKDLGYEDRAIVPGTDTENWTLRDMVAEIDYIRSMYVYKGPRRILKDTEPLRYNTELSRLYSFIREYKGLIDDMVTYTKHNSKYDNQEVNHE